MKGIKAEDKWQFAATAVFYITAGAALYFGFRYVFGWFLPFILGGVIAALLRPAALFLIRKCRLKEKLAAGLVLLLFYLAAAGVLILFLTIVLAQLYELLVRFPELYTQNIAPLLTRFSGWFYGLAARFDPNAGAGMERFSEAVSDAMRQAAVDASAHLVSFAAGVAAKLPMLALACVFTIAISALISANYRQTGDFLRGLASGKYKRHITSLQGFLRETAGHYLRAYTIIMAVTFVELVLGLWLLGFEYVPTVAAVITLLDLLPLIGSGAVLVPWGIVLLAGGETAGGAGLLLLFGVIAVVRNIIEPRVVGKQLGLHPIVTITAMYAGLKIAGIIGMLCAPVAVLFILHLRKNAPAN